MALSEQSIPAFADSLASSAPVPGGGGASALVGALGASLASMVGNLTVGKKKYAEYEADLKEILKKAESLQADMLRLIDEDARCFEPLSRAYGIPKDAPDRDETMEAALRLACSAPLDIMKTAAKAIELHAELALKGSTLMRSDVALGVLCCKTALQGASMNIYVNLRFMKNEAYAAQLRSETEALLSKYCPLAEETYDKMLDALR